MTIAYGVNEKRELPCAKRRLPPVIDIFTRAGKRFDNRRSGLIPRETRPIIAGLIAQINDTGARLAIRESQEVMCGLREGTEDF